MSKIKMSDFFYGSVLSMLLNNNVKPVLVESNEGRQVYDVTTNNGDIRLFMKYRADKIETKTEDYNSWAFVLLEGDKQEIQGYLRKGYNVVVALICGAGVESELALLDKNEIQQIIDLNKTSISVSRKKNEKAYRISLGGGRENAMMVKANRFEELF